MKSKRQSIAKDWCTPSAVHMVNHMVSDGCKSNDVAPLESKEKVDEPFQVWEWCWEDAPV